jgi:translation elongation factor EF-Tu-like GTPase
MIILRNKQFSNREKLNKLGWETDEDIREAVKGTKAEKKVNKILNKSAKDMREAAEKLYSKINNPGTMTIEDVFSISLIRGLGKNIAVAVGKVESGTFKVGDKVEISDGKNKIQTEIKGIQIFRKTVDKVSKGDDAGLEFSDISFRDIKRGMTIKVISTDQKQFSKQDREVVPDDIVEKVKNGGGVIQKDHNGDWRIVSMKTNPPTFWDAHYDSKALASKALGGYFANKR